MLSDTILEKTILKPEHWLNNYGDYLYGYAKLRVRNRDLAEDLVQDCLLSALKALNTFKGEASEKTWLTAILKNKIIDHYRKTSGQVADESYLQQTDAEFSEGLYQSNGSSQGWMKPEAYIKDWGQLPDELLENVELQQSLQKCLQKLPGKLAPVFFSKYLEDKNSDEICVAYKLTNANYWVIIHRAKILLRTCLEKNFVFIN